MNPVCFCCGRPAARFDKQIGKWVCEGNADCSMSMGVTKEQRESAAKKEPDHFNIVPRKPKLRWDNGWPILTCPEDGSEMGWLGSCFWLCYVCKTHRIKGGVMGRILP